MKWCARPRVFRASVSAALALLSLAGAAAGQPSDPSRPRDIVLFEDARALMKEGQYKKAASMLEESLRIKHGLGKLFQLSVCYENLGRTASAWSGYIEVARAAEAANREQEAIEARRRAAAIEPRLSKLRVRVTLPAADGIEVTRTGAATGSKAIIDSPSWGRDIPVDPDTYRIHVTAPGKAPWSATVVVEKPGLPVEVKVPALHADLPFEDSPDPPPPPPPSQKISPLPPEQPSPRDHERADLRVNERADPRSSEPPPAPRDHRVVPALLLGGGAAAALGVGVAFTVAWVNGASDVEALQGEIQEDKGSCWDGGVKHPRCGDLSGAASDVSLTRGAAIVSYTVGGLAVGGLITYLALSSSGAANPASKTSIQILPAASSEGGGLTVSGRF
jgi:hypothetical protein